ncbi:alpha-amylase family glycosyl hydrolase [Kiritimatiella glycovorans]|uniref:Trehalose-6-phosphate hydrolase n=1 Tax=Kiritimatiella glycovorans TaxID=1307763 RepID=A0A0G3ELL5_9BACT|nr:alpha-amylase family glycosyl hydrolase [Kiritimatiella glycovorans]AKJ65680.1 Trehalose-6-phosphate hydrolase [Kiritimatiella glycovorans]
MARKARPWYLDAVFYQIYPQTFCDSDGDGIGDLKGIESKLDYLADLGVDALWLNPIFESPMLDAGYDVTDYYRIHPRYGTREDFRRLVGRAHDRGMRVILDLVLNHTSRRHPWFLESRRMEKNPYSNWYVWNFNAWNAAALPGKWLTNLEGRHDSVLSTFHQDQVDLNFGLPVLRDGYGNSPDDPGVKRLWEQMRHVVCYWLDQGADGFRCDVPNCVGTKACCHEPGLNRAFWNYIREAVDAYGDRVMVAEMWDDASEAVNELGFHLQFTKNFCMISTPRDTLFSENRQFIRDGEAHDPVEFDRHLHLQTGNLRRSDGAIAMQTGSHDLPRPSTGSCGDDDLTMLALAINLTSNVVPFLYYGDEIGLEVNPAAPSHEGASFKAPYRCPMPWNAGRNAGFSEARKRDLYLPLHPDWRRRNVENQLKEGGSVLQEVKALIALRRTAPALSSAAEKITLRARTRDPLYVYLRRGGGQVLLVVVNGDARGRGMRLDLSGVLGKRRRPYRAGLRSGRHGAALPAGPLDLRDRVLSMKVPPRTYGVYEIA